MDLTLLWLQCIEYIYETFVIPTGEQDGRQGYCRARGELDQGQPQRERLLQGPLSTRGVYISSFTVCTVQKPERLQDKLRKADNSVT
jgi:hypothetical protein